jgi:hypothetical protein
LGIKFLLVNAAWELDQVACMAKWLQSHFKTFGSSADGALHEKLIKNGKSIQNY